MKKHLVVLTGAGMSAESGLRTFRDSGGLWENYNVEEVASIEGWYRNKALVLEFYNQRRRQLQNAQPNKGHYTLAELEQTFNVSIVTQNIDNLHEQAGSSSVLHLHGELTKACNANKNDVCDIAYGDINVGDKATDGTQLRPFIVWFGEDVPLLSQAAEIVRSADILLIIGTSLQVYPAAGLVNYARSQTTIYLIDPNDVYSSNNVVFIKKGASEGLEDFRKYFLSN